MSVTERKLPLAAAIGLASKIVAALTDHCERIEVAGSIRRLRPEVGDIEIVAIPKRRANLLGEEADSLLNARLRELCSQRRLREIKGGDKYKQFHITDAEYQRTGVGRFVCKLDLFLCSPKTWGVILLIRTGPAEFSKRFVMRRDKGGMLPERWMVSEGRIWPLMGLEGPLETPEETDVFKAIGAPFIKPEDRR